MNDDTPSLKARVASAGPAGAVAGAERDLKRVQGKVDAARAALLRLLQQVVVAESQLSNNQASRMLEANEALAVAALRDQAAAQDAALSLTETTRLAETDPLTRLPNRVLLRDRFAQAVATARRRTHRLALLFLDLDHFKQINDQMGHSAGDEVLQKVAQRLGRSVREADTVSRHGGDEFLILLTDVSQAADAAAIAGKLLAALNAPMRVANEDVHLTASIGISIYPDDGEDAAALISRADAAMYRAKQHRAGGFAFHAHPVGDPPVARVVRVPSPHEQLVAEHERRHAQLVEANEQLVLAALGFEALRDAADGARQLRAGMLQAVVHELGDADAPVRLAAALSGLDSAHEALLPRAVAIVERQMEHMARTVGALLQPVEGGPPELPGRRSIDVAALARAAVDDCRAAIESRHQVLDVKLHPEPVGVHGDPVQLVRVLARLLRNATDYTPDGGHLALHVEPVGPNVQLRFSDDGMGIEPDALATALQPFERDPRLRRDSEDSFGLGLTTVRAVVESHGGSVAASSAGAGRGSVFTITLPMVELPASPLGSLGA